MRAEPLTVTELTRHVAMVIRGDELLNDCTVRGEVSNYRLYASGHHYFTLKDAGAQLPCVMFRGDASRLRFEPGDGQRVRAAGRIDVYEQRGQYQMYVAVLQHDGLGALSRRTNGCAPNLRKRVCSTRRESDRCRPIRSRWR